MTALRRISAQPTWLLSRANLRAQQILHDAFAREGVRPYHFRLLAAIDEFGPASQADLGRRTGIDRSDIVAAVNGLVAGRLISREPDPDDRRVNRLYLTAGARRVHAEMWQIAEVAHARGMTVHVDGARFANAVASLDCAPADIAWRAGVDALSLGGTKNGLPFGEAIVFFDRRLAEEFGRRRMQGGQLASKMRYLAAPWSSVLQSGAWLRYATHANAMATRLAEGIADVPNTRLLAPVEANGVFVDVPQSMIAALRERGWQFYEFIGATGIRLMCSWDMTPEIVDALVADIRKLAHAPVIEDTGAARK